jgi:hypothetical protein
VNLDKQPKLNQIAGFVDAVKFLQSRRGKQFTAPTSLGEQGKVLRENLEIWRRCIATKSRYRMPHPTGKVPPLLQICTLRESYSTKCRA